jgi:hypothetical protein
MEAKFNFVFVYFLLRLNLIKDEWVELNQLSLHSYGDAWWPAASKTTWLGEIWAACCYDSTCSTWIKVNGVFSSSAFFFFYFFFLNFFFFFWGVCVMEIKGLRNQKAKLGIFDNGREKCSLFFAWKKVFYVI